MQTYRGTVAAIFLAFVLVLSLSRTADSAQVAPVAATQADKCPVCGMFVAKYPDFLAQIIFADGSHGLFDGAKDMFKYLFDLKKYNAAKQRSDIASIFVMDYYSMKPVDGRTAWYVIGSDVFGPMGRELIPFQQETEAKEFTKDHSGKQILRFDEVTPELIKGLE
jgi:nitrous oxide reductase accessory protein NosL